jgi:hypothetical protein
VLALKAAVRRGRRVRRTDFIVGAFGGLDGLVGKRKGVKGERRSVLVNKALRRSRSIKNYITIFNDCTVFVPLCFYATIGGSVTWGKELFAFAW